MKKTSKENIEISEILGNILGLKFKNEELSLGKWGDVDNWSNLSDGTLVLLECEKGQKHPNTNVLKLYPYMDNSDVKIVLIHYFYPENKAPKNRLALCDYLGEKMEMEFRERFLYVSLKCSKNEIYKLIKIKNKGLINRTLTLKIN